jgi:hypothetical protein
MRFLMIVKADEKYEAGHPPDPALMTAIGELSSNMAEAGILLDQGGLLPSSAGARIEVSDGRIAVVDGPFRETNELIGGYAIVKAESKAEAVELGKRFMQLHVDVLGPAYRGQLELRQFADAPPHMENRAPGRSPDAAPSVALDSQGTTEMPA